MPAKYIGAHMPTSGGLHIAIEKGVAIGCTAVQVFTSSPQQWRAKEVTEDAVQKFKLAVSEAGLEGRVVSHDSYLINLAAPNEELREKSRLGLTGEMVRCGQFGIPFVVSHMGAHMGQGTETGLQRVAEMALEVLKSSPEAVQLLMETTAGQGTCLNSKFEEIATIIEHCKGNERLGVCLDTCHIFAAGYDIRTEETYQATMDSFGSMIGMDRLKVIHCNDSKNPFASRKDRHENLGEGEIGVRAFELLVNDERFTDVLIVVETPDAETNHAMNVKRLWDWIQK